MSSSKLIPQMLGHTKILPWRPVEMGKYTLDLDAAVGRQASRSARMGDPKELVKEYSSDEDRAIIILVRRLGSDWVCIAKHSLLGSNNRTHTSIQTRYGVLQRRMVSGQQPRLQAYAQEAEEVGVCLCILCVHVCVCMHIHAYMLAHACMHACSSPRKTHRTPH